jgi:hypothetical protein
LFINGAVDFKDEQIGHAAQRFDPARDGAVRERGLQLIEQTFGSGNGFRTHDSILEYTYKATTVSPAPVNIDD